MMSTLTLSICIRAEEAGGKLEIFFFFLEDRAKRVGGRLDEGE